MKTPRVYKSGASGAGDHKTQVITWITWVFVIKKKRHRWEEWGLQSHALWLTATLLCIHTKPEKQFSLQYRNCHEPQGATQSSWPWVEFILSPKEIIYSLKENISAHGCKWGAKKNMGASKSSLGSLYWGSWHRYPHVHVSHKKTQRTQVCFQQ